MEKGKAKKFAFIRDEKTGEEWFETSLTGKEILTLPPLNKGTAFTRKERDDFGLIGKLPYQVESIEEQKDRAYEQYCSRSTDMFRH
jgi:malate dehydrogenase (oxaloacetate-decarboxylating)